MKKKTEKALRESMDTAERIWTRRYIPAWMFWLFRVQKQTAVQLASFFKYVVGSVFLLISFVICFTYLVVRIPNRPARIAFCNNYGGFFGRVCLYLSGSKVQVEGREHLDRTRAAIYITNHTSLLDIFLMMWLTPTGTCSVAKKQILYYPLYGILFWLSGHLMIDRSNTEKAVASLKELEKYVREKKLSVVIFPEGTRQRNGRIGLFKKGFVHMAIATGLPVVPIVVTNAHKGWKAKSATIAKSSIHVQVLPAYDTSLWRSDDVEGAIREIMDLYIKHLPHDQRPLPEDGDEPLIIPLQTKTEDEKVRVNNI